MLPTISKLLKAIWLYIAGFIAVGVIYVLLTGIEQGIDVVIQSGESASTAIFTVLAIVLWSFLVWYSSRILGYIKQSKEDSFYTKKCADDVLSDQLYYRYAIPASFHKHIPRLLAFNCFVAVQAAIFHLPSFQKFSSIPPFAIVAVHNALYYFVSQWFQRWRDRESTGYFRWVALLVSVAYIGILLYQAIAMHGLPFYERHKFWLPLISILLFVLQIWCIYFFIWRRARIDAGQEGGTVSKTLIRLQANERFNAAETPLFRVYNWVALLAFAIYIVAICSIPVSDSLGPMAFVLLALGILVGFSNMVSALSVRVSVNMFLFLYILAIIIGYFGSPYKVRLLPTGQKQVYAKRPDIKTYLDRWFSQRQLILEGMDSNSKFPVYLVMSNGGASRAGNWVSGVMSRLQDLSAGKDSTNTFSDHLLCIAGASGGSVGNCAFYCMLRARMDGMLRDELSPHNAEFFHTDFLTYTLSRLLGPDMFRHLLPLSFISDRAAAIEQVMANGSGDPVMDNYFGKPLSDVFDYSGKLPVIFINTTRMTDGMPGVISSVQLPTASQRIDVLNLVDKVSIDPAYRNLGNIRVSTSAVLSSRFPYVSPAGEILHHYFVDGGYFDNSGAGIIEEFVQELIQYLNSTSNPVVLRYRNRLNFQIIHIYNSEVLPPGVVYAPTKDIHPLTNDLASPLITLAGLQNSSTKIGNGILLNNFRELNNDRKDAFIEYSLYKTSWDSVKNCVTHEEPYPMSWSISDYQLERMSQRIESANAENKNRFWFMQAR